MYKDIICEGKKYKNVLEKERLERAFAALENKKWKNIKVIGITGTKGKTTTSWMLYNILKKAGKKCALCGTMGAYILEEYYEEKNTTPSIEELVRLINLAESKKCEYFIMEVSSQGLKQCRVTGITFDYGIFTNISRDHIGIMEHENMEEYIFCKSMLFAKCKISILNRSDKEYLKMEKYIKGELYYYRLTHGDEKTEEDDYLSGKIIKSSIDTTSFKLYKNGSIQINDIIELPLPGRFNVENALAAMTVAFLEKIPQKYMTEALKEFFVEGREEKIYLQNGAVVIIDYAHNHTSMESILKEMNKYRHNRIISLFGCGGNRSLERRNKMGEISGKYADLSIITEDNSRFEEPSNIIKDIEKGILKTSGKYVIIQDRKKAIEYALDISTQGDIIMLLGKGHEKYQEKSGLKIPFSEKDIVNHWNKKH